MPDSVNRHRAVFDNKAVRPNPVNRERSNHTPAGPVNDRPATGLFGTAAGGRKKPMSPTPNPGGMAPAPKPTPKLHIRARGMGPQTPTSAPGLRAVPRTGSAATTATKAAERGSGAGAGLVLGAAIGGVGVAALRHKRKEQQVAKSAFGVEDARITKAVGEGEPLHSRSHVAAGFKPAPEGSDAAATARKVVRVREGLKPARAALLASLKGKA